MEGKIGKIELEANENLPLTWSQQKDIIMQLFQSANPEILAVLGTPENLPIIRDAIGLVDFFVPSEDDVEKQYDEIKLLTNDIPKVYHINLQDETDGFYVSNMGSESISYEYWIKGHFYDNIKTSQDTKLTLSTKTNSLNGKNKKIKHKIIYHRPLLKHISIKTISVLNGS